MILQKQRPIRSREFNEILKLNKILESSMEDDKEEEPGLN